jgi:hypothetical protein
MTIMISKVFSFVNTKDYTNMFSCGLTQPKACDKVRNDNRRIQDMAYVHIRIEDDFYKAVQTVLETKLKTDLSSFVRDVLHDTLLIYADAADKEAALTAIGRKHEAQGNPTLILDMAEDWAEKQKPITMAQLRYTLREFSMQNKDGPPRLAKKTRNPADPKTSRVK